MDFESYLQSLKAQRCTIRESDSTEVSHTMFLMKCVNMQIEFIEKIQNSEMLD